MSLSECSDHTTEYVMIHTTQVCLNIFPVAAFERMVVLTALSVSEYPWTLYQ